MVRRAWLLLAGTLAAGTLALAGCVEPPPPPTPGFRGPSILTSPSAGEAPASYGAPLSAAAPVGRGVALLAPLTGPNAERGAALVNAAKLALQSPGSPQLDVRDTGGTAEGAAAAAGQAIAAGAGLIIGPLTAGETAGAARVAKPAGVAILAFTTDPAQAQPGVWTLGITPAQQVRRLVGAAVGQGKTRIAALLPQTDFGQAMAAALGQAATGGAAPDVHMYPPGNPTGAVRDLAAYGSRVSPLMGEIRAARAAHDAQGRERAANLSRQDVPPPPFDALLLADTGGALTTLTGLLQGYEVGPPGVRIMGPALWAAPAARGGAELTGAWYAAPDPASRADFAAQYQTAYSTPAPGLTDFAYDAASIARVVAQSGGPTTASLCRPDGFAGVDGVFVLQPDGTVRRSLALFEVRPGGPTMVEPASSAGL